jgi:3-(3-hydroxy-phenyl)propionate hydroxylase
LTGSVLNTPDADAFEGNMVPGAPMDDAPVQVNGQDAWLLNQVGKGFQVMLFVDAPLSPDVLAQLADVSWHGGSTPLRANAPPLKPTLLIVAPSPLNIPGMNVIVDTQGLVAKRYDAQPGTTYLLRPDQHVLARWRTLDSDRLQAAMARALGQVGEHA